MPLSQNTIDTINILLQGDPENEEQDHIYGLETEQINAREDIIALLRIHNDIPDSVCTEILINAKNRYKAAINALDALLV